MPKHKKGIDINGVILLDKDLGQSSNRALQQVKRLLNANKAGHTGSLDPLASGILPICLGHATKLSQFLLDANKRYVAIGQLGRKTDTADAQGEVVEVCDFSHITKTEVEKVLPQFLGKQSQVPPMYSALKKEGQPLYKLARLGISVERKQREINIFELKLLSFNQGAFEIEVLCSKGTYIRTLVEDIAQALGNIAFTSYLRRIGFAHYDIGQTINFNQLETSKNPLQYLQATQDMLINQPSLVLGELEMVEIKFGRKIFKSSDQQSGSLIKLFSTDGQFLGLGRVKDGNIHPKRLFIDHE